MSYKFDKKIMITTEFKGTHNWPEATQFAGPSVQFLEYEHRHTYKVKVELTVKDSDREVEFFIFQHQVNDSIEYIYPYESNKLVRRLYRRSCETIAEEIIEHLRDQYGYTNMISIEVWEDGEVGACITSSKL